MNIGIYNPYRDTLGGGEQYMLTFASYFLQKGHAVTYYSSDVNELKNIRTRFGMDLPNLQIKRPVFESGTLFQKLQETRKLDILLFYSDGSVPISFAKKTFLVFQFPTPWVNASAYIDRMKQKLITNIIVNSSFTKKFVDKSFGVNATVINPAVNTSLYHNTDEKQNIILSVGRFTKGMNTKKHDILISSFKELMNQGISKWQLILAGGIRDEDHDMIAALTRQIDGYPISLKVNLSRNEILALYKQAAIYWHASGYDVDEERSPEKVEHFGISTVEAMAAGAIPIIFPAGGQKEIVTDKHNGFYWKSTEELTSITSGIIKDRVKLKEIASNAVRRAEDFNLDMFNKKSYSLFQI